MEKISTVGVDIAKSVLQVHGVDAEDKVVVRKQLPLDPDHRTGPDDGTGIYL